MLFHINCPSLLDEVKEIFSSYKLFKWRTFIIFIQIIIIYLNLPGKDSVTLQGEDKAMQRYRSLNMNGDVVAKVRYIP